MENLDDPPREPGDDDFIAAVRGLTKLAAQLKRSGRATAERRAAPPAGALPCLNVTTAWKGEIPETEIKPLPGPRHKQAMALAENIKWMAETFGPEKIGFLTLTLGDYEAGGRFRNLRDRKEAQRRFHSLLTNEISKRYPCGVVITERHKNGGLHFHLAVVCREDIRGDINFAACFPPKDERGKPLNPADYFSANAALKQEWAFWRRTAKRYGFGRHQLQPMRKDGESLGGYLAKYLRKDWQHRLAADKGARCLRYFGHWSAVPRSQNQRRKVPPNGARFGWLTPKARAWRERVKQIITVLKYKGVCIGEENIKALLGPRWAYKIGKLSQVVRFVPGEWLDEPTRLAMAEHNAQVAAFWREGGGNPKRDCWWDITEVTMDHLRPSRAWQKQVEELQLAKDAEAAIRKGLKELGKAKAERAHRLELVKEVADEMAAALESNEPF